MQKHCIFIVMATMLFLSGCAVPSVEYHPYRYSSRYFIGDYSMGLFGYYPWYKSRYENRTVVNRKVIVRQKYYRTDKHRYRKYNRKWNRRYYRRHNRYHY